MSTAYYDLDYVFSNGKYKDMTVEEVVYNYRDDIINLIKEGYNFTDEVLKLAHISRTIRDERFTHTVFGNKIAEDKKYEKDKSSVNQIIKELNTLEYNENNKSKESNVVSIDRIDIAMEEVE